MHLICHIRIKKKQSEYCGNFCILILGVNSKDLIVLPNRAKL